MSELSEDAATREVQAARRPRRVFRRVLVGIGSVVGALLAVGLFLYLFGGPGGVTPEVRAAYESQVDAGAVVPVADRFVVPIPGCTCHSDDAVVVVQHAERRVRECFRCH